MEKFFLEIPTINRKKEALDYLEEHVRYNSDLNGTGSMDRCLAGMTYEEWLLELEKGYAKLTLYLGLLEEQKNGEERVLLDCTTDNIGSNKTILALGGKLEKTEIDVYDNMMTNYYWINVNDSIEKYYEFYKNYIKYDSKIRK
ncbi:MAG: hypothetical protein NC483_01775 [Ruminococcus sp.]|nr:hypothetical protein [Ruminococcus sp.]